MKHLILVVIILLLFAGNTFGQKVIYGKVSDAKTGEPLPFSNVYVNHTTIGTVADKDGIYSLEIPRGEYEVVCSFVGYQSFKIQTSARGPDSVQLDIKLVSSKQELESVTIHGSADKEWERLIKQFQRVFLGNSRAASNCIIRNAWCIDVSKERISGQQVLTARASQPIEIENSALGYKLFYDLQDFSASKKNDRFTGNVYFVKMEPKDSVQAERWALNRQTAYRGSVRHLFKSILENRTKEEGFTLSVYQTSDNTILHTAFTPSGIQLDSLNRKFTIPMENDIAIYYYSSPSSDPKVATMSFVNRSVEVDHNGAVFDPLSFTITGYLGRSRVANLLPNDYQPANHYDNLTVPLLPSDEASRYQLPDGTFVEVSGNDDELGGMPASPMLDALEKRVTHYAEARTPEKVYVHFDKPFYYAGEDSWYKVYVVNGTDLRPTEISTVLYLDWIDPSGNVIKHQRLKIENGAAVGDFAFDTTLQQGTYTVRAYTNWMRNEDSRFFYYKKLTVFNTFSAPTDSHKDPLPGPIDLQFFPEGGTLVTDIMTSIAFKAIDTNGKGIATKGKIIDDQNNVITTFQSIHNGMGIFPLIAQANKSYYAVLPGGEKFSLPLPSEQVLSLAVSNMNENKVLVRIRSGEDCKSPVYLIAHSRGSIHFAESVTLQPPYTNVVIAKDELPEGVVQLTLFNTEGVPQSERMVFIRKDHGMVVTVTSDQGNYQPRDSILIDVVVRDNDGYPVETSLSVSITDAAFVSANTNSENIYTQLLLQSDLKGYVEQPGWYFDTVSTQKIYALDLVMLTHGWSRYQWNKMPIPTSEPVAFQPEKGITLKGQILDNGMPVVNAPFTLLIPQSENQYFNIYESDSLGHFVIPDLDFPDSTLTSWSVMSGKKGVAGNAEIHFVTTTDIPPVTQAEMEFKNEIAEKIQTRYFKTGGWNPNNARILDEVVVTGSRVPNIISTGRGLIVKPDEVDIKSRISTSQFVNRYAIRLPFAILKEMPDGTQVWGVNIRNQFVPVVLIINGVREETTGFAGNPQTILSGIPIEQVGYVYADGASIVVSTKNTSPESFGTIKKVVNGYDVTRQFYHPKYGPQDISSPGLDNRMTLYWNSNLRTDKDGNTIVRFYNTDSTKKLFIVVEGIANGIPIYSTTILGEE